MNREILFFKCLYFSEIIIWIRERERENKEAKHELNDIFIPGNEVSHFTSQIISKQLVILHEITEIKCNILIIYSSVYLFFSADVTVK